MGHDRVVRGALWASVVLNLIGVALFLFVGALGKLGFFALAVAYWAAGDLPAAAVPQAMPDLALALVFLWWLWTTRRGGNS